MSDLDPIAPSHADPDDAAVDAGTPGPADDDGAAGAADAAVDARPPARTRAPVRWRRVLIGVVGLALWLGLAYLYSVSGSTTLTEPPPIDDGVFVSVEPLKIDPGANSMQVRLSFLPVGSYASGQDADLAKPVVLRLYLTTGLASTVRFAAGQPMRPVETEVYLDGEYAQYPFDRYQSTWGLSLSTPGAASGRSSPVPIGLAHGGSASSWRLLVDAQSAAADDAQAVGFSYELWRSPSTIVFALLLLGLMVVLAVLGAVVASKVASRRSKAEATMASWFGAMIFALVPLRTFLPGAPPVGAWIDVLVLFWVMLVLVASLAAFVVTWWRTAPPGPAPGDRREA